jgi:5-methylcytosine-specific restriction endonuclease McrA
MQGMVSLVTKGLALSTKRNDPRLSRKYKEVRLRKLAEDGWTCYYCGYEGKDMTIDHIIPVSKAPELAIEISNMVSCCKPCNSKKGNRSQGVFLDTLRTPPVFSVYPSPMQSKMHEDSPFSARPVQN